MKQEKLLVIQTKADYSQQHKEDKYMSKAILVMDMPDCCFHCDCCHEKPYDKRYRIEGEKFCGIEDMEVSEYYDSFYSEEPMRPSWCPLKEMPEKMKYCNGTYNGEVKGWNLCLEEILKENKSNEG